MSKSPCSSLTISSSRFQVHPSSRDAGFAGDQARTSVSSFSDQNSQVLRLSATGLAAIRSAFTPLAFSHCFVRADEKQTYRSTAKNFKLRHYRTFPLLSSVIFP